MFCISSISKSIQNQNLNKLLMAFANFKLTYLQCLAVALLKHQYFVPCKHGLCFLYFGWTCFVKGLEQDMDNDSLECFETELDGILNQLYLMQWTTF